MNFLRFLNFYHNCKSCKLISRDAVLRTVIEEIYQNERRLTQFSRFSTKQMFPTDRPPWADAKNRAQYKEGVALPVRIPASHASLPVFVLGLSMKCL